MANTARGGNVIKMTAVMRRRRVVSSPFHQGRVQRTSFPHSASVTAPTPPSSNGKLYDSRRMPITSLV